MFTKERFQAYKNEPTELSSTYTWWMAKSDSDRAKVKTGYFTRLSNAEYEESRSRAQINIPSILLLLPLMTSLIITTAKFA